MHPPLLVKHIKLKKKVEVHINYIGYFQIKYFNLSWKIIKDFAQLHDKQWESSIAHCSLAPVVS